MNTYLRTWALDDISISRSGDGRTVTAYAAMFDAPYEVRDQHGHYMERIERSAFNRTLSHGGASRVACLFNHGLTVHGTPDGKLSVPLGTPLEIKPDGRGLLTVTRYNRGEVADLVLESIRNGDIRSQSFRGRIFRSSPERLPRGGGGALPTVVRHELGLSDYGPTPVPVNAGAEILAVRSVQRIADELEHLDDEAREELLAELARHLPGKHRQGSHGNRFSTPGDRSSGLRRKGVSKLDPADGGRDNDDTPAAPQIDQAQQWSGIDSRLRGIDSMTERQQAIEAELAKPDLHPDNRQRLQALRQVATEHAERVAARERYGPDWRNTPATGTVRPLTSRDDRRDAYQQHDMSREKFDALPEREQQAILAELRSIADSGDDAGNGRPTFWVTGAETLTARFTEERRTQAPAALAAPPATPAPRPAPPSTAPSPIPEAPAAPPVDPVDQRMRQMTPVLFDALLGSNGKPPAVKNARQRQIVEAMRESGWTLLDSDGRGGYLLMSPNDTERLRVSAIGDDVRVYDEGWGRISGTKALAKIGAARSESAAFDDLLATYGPEANTATPDGSGPGAEDSHQQVHSGRLSIRRNRIRAELISLGVIKP